MNPTHRFQCLKSYQPSYWLCIVVCAAMIGLGAYCALTMEHAGHIVSGMNNHVVWGLPHVFAVSLIVSASGALNGATLASVFNNPHYKPIARLSVALAMCLLIGGLLVLVLDLGRPDRLIVAMTTYNFRSIFAWNIFLYTGFIVIGVGYLWMMMEKRFNRHVLTAGRIALFWRIVLTSGTGCIFGFLVGRNALDSALLAPMFIALSLVMGTAALSLVLVVLARWEPAVLTTALAQSLNRVLIWFLLALLYFSVVHHLTNLYVSEHHDIERHLLSGEHAALFWFAHILVGVIAPIVIIFSRKPEFSLITRVVTSSVCALFGSAALLYVIIIGSQSSPQVLFPGKTVVQSSFGDAGFATYQASLWEWGLGVGGVAMALLLCLVVLRVLPLLPESIHGSGIRVNDAPSEPADSSADSAASVAVPGS